MSEHFVGEVSEKCLSKSQSGEASFASRQENERE